VWGREVDGRVLTFHLAGINNQNFLMRDEETGTYWQQISGKAISGPLKGRTLPLVHSDELSFRVWREEQPQGRVLKPVARDAGDYEKKDWDVRMAKARVVLHFPKSGLPEREQVFGVYNNSASRAFPVKKVLASKLVMDHIGPDAVILVAASDGASVRVFRNCTPERDFYHADGAADFLFTDAQTGSKWNFQGCAVDGPDKGRCLDRVYMVKDYWFDWKNYHPETTIFH
jgi:hypothetical protein